MKGKHKGVQKKSIRSKSKSFTTHHVVVIILMLHFVIWKILGLKAKSFFGIVQCIYIYITIDFFFISLRFSVNN